MSSTAAIKYVPPLEVGNVLNDNDVFHVVLFRIHHVTAKAIQRSPFL